jgi:hypothetical protein
MRRGTAVAFFATAVTGLCVSGCGGGGSTDPAPGSSAPHADGKGPLSASLPGGGGVSLAAPGQVPWDGTFGSALLCSHTGDKITVQDIRYQTRVNPLAATPTIRSVPAQAERTKRGDWAPVAARVGIPGAFASAPHQARGELSTQVKGLTISQPCGHRSSAPYTELLTVLQAGRAGAWVDGIDID